MKKTIEVIFTDGEVMTIENASGFCFCAKENVWKITRNAMSLLLNAHYVRSISRIS